MKRYWKEESTGGYDHCWTAHWRRESAKINVTNPATGAIICTVPVATQADIDYAVRRALIGQRLWQNRPMHERISILEKFADLLETHSLQVAETETARWGNPLPSLSQR